MGKPGIKLPPSVHPAPHAGDDGIVAYVEAFCGGDTPIASFTLSEKEFPVVPLEQPLNGGKMAVGLSNSPAGSSGVLKVHSGLKSAGSGSGSVGPKSTPYRKMPTGGSESVAGDDVSIVSKASERLRAKNQPKFNRCNSQMSGLSAKTASSDKSSVLPELEIGKLRGIASVSFTSQWSVRDDYEFGEQVGEGGFGKVFLCTHRQTLKNYAAKVIPASSTKDVERFEREHKAFERLSHPHVVRLHEIFRSMNDVYLVMDLCSGGDLMDYTINYWTDQAHPERVEILLNAPAGSLGLPWREAVQLIWQMLSSIAYLHHHRFCHRDIKLENFMIREVTSAPHVQLCDFGLSVRFEKGAKISGKVGTLLYMAPELLKEEDYNERCDIWSVGVCAYIVSALQDPWGGSSDPHETVARITKNAQDEIPSNQPKQLRKLLDMMLVSDPANRPSAKDVVRMSAWLRKHGRQKKNAGCDLM